VLFVQYGFCDMLLNRVHLSVNILWQIHQDFTEQLQYI